MLLQLLSVVVKLKYWMKGPEHNAHCETFDDDDDDKDDDYKDFLHISSIFPFSFLESDYSQFFRSIFTTSKVI